MISAIVVQLGSQLQEQPSEDWSISSQGAQLPATPAPIHAAECAKTGTASATTVYAAPATEDKSLAAEESQAKLVPAATSPAELLLVQAQEAAARAHQRQQKQQQVALLQQALAKQNWAAGAKYTFPVHHCLRAGKCKHGAAVTYAASSVFQHCACVACTPSLW